jgi:hypothetical protein
MPARPATPELSDPTVQALVALARPDFGPRQRARVLARLERLDWALLQRLALLGDVAGLVAESLSRLGPGLAPLERWRGLLAARLALEQRNRRLMEQARLLCRAALDSGLTLVPIKGAALLLGRPYARLDQRPMVDIDLLTRRAEVARVERLLSDLGYAAEDRRRHAMRHEHHVRHTLDHPAGRLHLELHWTPFYTLYSTPARDEQVFGRLVTHHHRGQRIRLLDGEDSLLSLLSHIEHHRFRGPLKLAVDVAALVQHLGPGLDWPRLWRRARRLGASGATAYALSLVRRLLRPRGWPELPAGGRLRNWGLDRLGSPRWLIAGHPRPPVWQRTLIDLLLQDRPMDGLRYLVHKAGEIYERDHGGWVPDALARGGRWSSG